MKFLKVSKPAALVLLWIFCLSTALWSIIDLNNYFEAEVLNDSKMTVYLLKSSLGIAFLTFPLFGWLADQQFGNFKVFKAGCVLVFLGSVLGCVCILVANNLSKQKALLTIQVLKPVSNFFGLSGAAACIVTLIQIALDQLPDASSSEITSFILFFSNIACTGIWSSNFLIDMLKYCTLWNLSAQSVSLLPVLCSCIVLSSLFLLGNKWLIIEPKSPQSLKMIYQVLKFAAKHKAPINRSALTYWEEDIPCRLDLGKLRYGGPFTTEQVEDVKTFFRLLLLSLPAFICALTAGLFGTLQVKRFIILDFYNSSVQICKDAIYSSFIDNARWCCMVTLLAYTICIYPCCKNKLPSMMRRVGTYLALLTLINIAYSFVGYFFNLSIWPRIFYKWLFFSLSCLVLATGLEFMCAQSPYNMRGLLTGLGLVTIFSSVETGLLIYSFTTASCTSKHCLIILYSAGSVLSITGFLLYLVIAYRYKRRVRDEEYNPYPHIEDIYDRYLTQAQNVSPCETCASETLDSENHS